MGGGARGDWRRAAELWAALDAPYEVALAQAAADDEAALADALERLRREVPNRLPRSSHGV